MFTGLIEHVGTIQTVSPGPGGGRVLTIRHAFDPSSLQIGDSIATSGVCLTVTKLEGDRFTVDVGPETLLPRALGHARHTPRRPPRPGARRRRREDRADRAP
ncbi:hypothetical protein L6R52_32820 [Myxococcota bacterium]|nr:hypothetical protein [Myxococcota bacterium]